MKKRAQEFEGFGGRDVSCTLGSFWNAGSVLYLDTYLDYAGLWARAFLLDVFFLAMRENKSFGCGPAVLRLFG